jgi:hypothetical protein
MRMARSRALPVEPNWPTLQGFYRGISPFRTPQLGFTDLQETKPDVRCSAAPKASQGHNHTP